MKFSQKLYSEVRKKNPIFWLLIIYFAGVIFALELVFTSQNPFVMPDEVLYSNIARSLISGRGCLSEEPAGNVYESPVPFADLAYAFCRAGTQFRAVLLFNSLVMNLAVFPTYQDSAGLPKTAN